MRLILPLAAAACALVASRCTHDTGQESRLETVFLSVVSGNDQEGRGGEVLAEPVVVGVTDAEGGVLEGVALRVEVTEGGGRIGEGTYIQTGEEGLARFEWTIGSGYNGVEVAVAGAGYGGEPCHAYAEGENPTGIAITRTLTSLRRVEGVLYEITFYGDYSDIVDAVNQAHIAQFTRGSSTRAGTDIHCSVFAAMGDANRRLFGRSFDNPAGWRCITLLCRFFPPDGYASLVPTRTRELGYEPGTDLMALPVSGREGLLAAPFFSPDGINEHGLVVALADIESRRFTPDPGKESVYKTRLIREILDHARSVDEAVGIAERYNCFDYGLDVFSTHALVADPSGCSAVLELAGGMMRAIPNTEEWQVATNSPLYGVTIPDARLQCWRYWTVYDFLATRNGSLTMEQGMEILETVGNVYTQWSIVYNMTGRRLDLALDYDFGRFYRFAFAPIE